MMSRVAACWHDEEGATMIEYALMLTLVAIVCILVVTVLGLQTGNSLNWSQSQLPNG